MKTKMYISINRSHSRYAHRCITLMLQFYKCVLYTVLTAILLTTINISHYIGSVWTFGSTTFILNIYFVVCSSLLTLVVFLKNWPELIAMASSLALSLNLLGFTVAERTFKYYFYGRETNFFAKTQVLI